MAVFAQVLSVTLPIFMLVALGYFATAKAILPKDGNQALAAFAINFALPAVLFTSVSAKPMTELFDGAYFLAYGGGSLAAFVVVYCVARLVLQAHGQRAAIWALGSSLSNTLMIGLPILTLVWGAETIVAPLALMVMVETIIILPLSLVLAESSGQTSGSVMQRFASGLKPLTKNPIIIAIVAGALVSLLNIPVPVVISRMMDLLAMTVSGVALMALGGMLVGVPLGHMLKPILVVIPAKLIVHPLLIAISFYLVGGVDKTMMAIAIVNGSLSMFGILPIIASRFNLGSEAASIVVPATMLSFISINISLVLTQLYL